MQQIQGGCLFSCDTESSSNLYGLLSTVDARDTNRSMDLVHANSADSYETAEPRTTTIILSRERKIPTFENATSEVALCWVESSSTIIE